MKVWMQNITLQLLDHNEGERERERDPLLLPRVQMDLPLLFFWAAVTSALEKRVF